MTAIALVAATALCDCSDHQLDAVGCECGGEPRARRTYEEMVAQQARVERALIERALDRDERAERAYWDAEREKDLARGYDWDPAWGEQQPDQHVRAHLTLLAA